MPIVDEDFYPSSPSNYFPHQLESNILKVIASLDNHA
jgi:hypothetical protein